MKGLSEARVIHESTECCTEKELLLILDLLL